MPIHPTAIISPTAKIDPSALIGPYVLIEGPVVIGSNCIVEGHAVLKGPLVLGEGCHVHHHAMLGGDPQDQKYKSELTGLTIGTNNIFREFCTISRGTAQGGGQTHIGHGSLFMAYSHVAHDCIIEDNCILANAATLAGHVEIANRAIIGGLSAIHQHVRIGEGAMIAGGSMVSQDVLPFVIAQGDRAKIRGINRIGLQRNPISDHEFITIFYRFFRLNVSRQKRLEFLRSLPVNETCIKLIQFIETSKRGICSFNGT